MTEDYLAQIKWQSEHPWYDGSNPLEPEWKYKPVYKVNKPTPTARLFGTLGAIICLIILVFAFFQLSEKLPGAGIVAIIIIFFTALLIYLMGRPTK